jgi:hypothetical protein
MSSLTLIGTVHRDPSGFQTLIEELTRQCPQIITVEFSSYGLGYRLKRKRVLTQRLLQGVHEIRGVEYLSVRELKKLLKSSGIGGIRALLDVPFEYKGARVYSKRYELPLHCIDSSFHSRQLLSHVEELISPENLKKVVAFESAPLKATIRREYQNAENLLLNGTQSPWLQVIHADEVWERREHIMADRIKNISAKYPGRTIVHVGGWRHLLARKGTLFNLLEELEPKRVLLGRRYL